MDEDPATINLVEDEGCLIGNLNPIAEVDKTERKSQTVYLGPIRRLLVELEWSSRVPGDVKRGALEDSIYQTCPSCGGLRPLPHVHMVYSINEVGHRRECKLAAALRQVTILPAFDVRDHVVITQDVMFREDGEAEYYALAGTICLVRAMDITNRKARVVWCPLSMEVTTADVEFDIRWDRLELTTLRPPEPPIRKVMKGRL